MWNWIWGSAALVILGSMPGVVGALLVAAAIRWFRSPRRSTGTVPARQRLVLIGVISFSLGAACWAGVLLLWRVGQNTEHPDPYGEAMFREVQVLPALCALGAWTAAGARRLRALLGAAAAAAFLVAVALIIVQREEYAPIALDACSVALLGVFAAAAAAGAASVAVWDHARRSAEATSHL